MTVLAHAPASYQHALFHGVSWNDYERVLAEIGDGPTRVSFLDGVMEIVSPLPEHDSAKSVFGDLIAELAVELRIPRKSFGSTTFRRQEKKAGTEPDECFYFNEIDSVKGMKKFDPSVHRAPDLAIEVDVMNSSLPREAIFARLGIPELWRYRSPRITIRLLRGGKYTSAAKSELFPRLPMDRFAEFVQSMIEEDETRTLLDFREWLRKIMQ